MAYVLVPHLSPTHHSELSQLLARITAMAVTEAVDGEALRPNHVYVLPSDKVLRMGDETILVAEDEESVRAWLCRALRELGYTVLEASDGRAALGLIAEQGAAPDLVLGDAVMPGIGGIELRDRLAPMRPELPVLLISAYGTDELTRRGVVARDSVILPKPLDIRELAAGIRNLLDASGRAPRAPQ